MRAKLFALVAIAALVASAVVPLASEAAFPDSVLIIGKWNHEVKETDGDDTYTSTTSYRFDIGGGGKSIYKSERETDGYKSVSESEAEFDWKIEDGILYIYHPSSYAATRGDPDWDAATQFKLEFDSAYSKIKLYAKNYWTEGFSETATEYEKSGSYFGVACPCCFMYFAIAPLVLFAGLAIQRLRK